MDNQIMAENNNRRETMSNAALQEVIEPSNNQLAPFDDFRTQLETLKAENAKTVFQYEDPKGNAAARSYIRKLASTAVAIDKRRKDLGEESREYIKRVNAEGQALEAEVRKMMEPHQKAINEIEEREKKRVSEVRERIERIRLYQECKGHDSTELKNGIAELEAIAIDTSFAEFMAEATIEHKKALDAHKSELEIALKREAEQAELERLRKEAADRAQKDHEERIAREAAEKREAELKAEVERAEKLRLQAIADVECQKKQAEQDAIDAAAKAEKDKQDAIEAERKRVEKEAADKAAADAKREADIKHQKKIHADIIEGLAGCGVDETTAKAIITAIRKGEIPHIKIEY